MNVIVTGASGLLGRAVVQEFKRNSWKVLSIGLTRIRDDTIKMDIRDIDAVARIVKEFKPHAIIHCAVKRSEKPEKYPNESLYFNENVSAQLAKLADEIKSVFIFMSTDNIFSGNNPPYSEEDMPNPVTEFGFSKKEAETQVLTANPGSCILRIPLLYGGDERVGESVVSSLINAIKSNDPTSLSNLEVYYPTHTRVIAGIIYQLVQKKLQDQSLVHNIYHWSGTEPFTMYEMARIIADRFDQNHDHISPMDGPIPHSEIPLNTHLNCERLLSLGIQCHSTFAAGIEDFSSFI